MSDDGRAGSALRVGIDVGGTNTDAVVLDAGDRIVARAKRPTSPDVTGGLRDALDAVLAEVGERGREVGRVMLGTTHATNAILERRSLGRVAVVRLGAPATRSIPPLTGWPEDLRHAVSAGEIIVGGGHFVDGRPIAPLERAGIRRFLAGVEADAVAVTGVFSPANPDQEHEVAEIVREELGGGTPISLSHEIGSLGLVERENAAVLNAALYGVARDVTGALRDALAGRGLAPATYFTQNDGTLMAVDHAARYPVLTIGSGPANSLRGAVFLSGVPDAVVADVGGTSTDLGVLVGGSPRESSAAVDIGGVTTGFRMPDILAIALGGGSVVRDGAVGPRSVGHRLTREALVFGGPTPTMTDAAVAAGRGRVGTRPVPAGEDVARRLAAAVRRADAMVADAVDRVLFGRADRPLVAVGGGAFIVPGAIPGVGEVVRPRDADVANAVGAAVALAGGRFDTIVGARGDREAAIERAGREAADRAVAAGADPSKVEIVELAEVPLSYLEGPAVRVHVKAVGPLK
ncbi:N-methylhydantoinase A/oxoprolinase/acetone carboxylase, beta subunit [Sinosporangium album]|uniref:N-methylhydantoinase A/oxoprolinase/acetone carboxylase, beta subunit n=1 Tax=Sinosporangium album TaxID=504805 RepID=A0A1G8I5J8_9ACTN|nr:hydantoinase/oxoprolinase family protein [Sinosporangium album]SDI14021.1 N-methylhydantoinase A/oxoprolinase/acetone carboxylase, beta subunit [Sinosporangium album]